MRMHPFHRTELLVGSAGWQQLQGASVAVIGLGGVGAYVVEALVRSGVGHLTVCDFDKVCLTNLNRQLHATRATVGQSKAELMGERVRSINPRCDVRVVDAFYEAANADEVLDRRFDAVIDCIDNMTAKVHLIQTCVQRGLPVWSAMGAGGRTDPTRIHVTDLSDTHTDPFAKIVRKSLREVGIEQGVRVVWSDEPPNDLDAAVQEGFTCICPDKANSPNSCDRRFQVQGTVAWMPAMFGFMLAGAVANHLLGRELAPPRVSADGHERRRARMRPAVGKPGKAQKKAILAERLNALQPVSRTALDAERASEDG